MALLTKIWNRLPKTVRLLIGYFIAVAVGNPIEQWIDDKLGINDAMIDKTLHSIVQYGIPAIVILIFIFLYHLIDYFWFTRWKAKRSVIELTASPPETQLVSMPEASRRAYEEARKTGSLWAYAAESDAKRARDSEGATEIILSYMANLITSKVTVFGFSPPSEILEEIDLKNQTGVFSKRGSEWGKLFGNRVIYTNIQVKKTDLDEILDYLKHSHKATDPI